jgi:hypothetical protein
MGKSCWLCVFFVVAINAPNARAEDKIPVANEGGIGKTWILPPGSKLAGLAYPPEYRDHQEEVCLAIGYLINPDGHTSDLTLLKSWSSGEPKRDRDRYWGAFAGVASAELSKWHFVPKSEVGVPNAVYTVATFVFASPSVLESSKRCEIPNLSQQILGLMQNTRLRRRMTSTGVFTRLDLDRMMVPRYQNYRGISASQMNGPPLPPPPPPRPEGTKEGSD